MLALYLFTKPRWFDQLLTTLRNFTDPFKEDGNELINLVTTVIMPEKVKNDICERGEIGKKLFETLVTDTIKTNKVNLWSPMKRRKLLTWKDSEKVLKLSCKDKVIELKEDRSLFAKLMAVCKSRPEINIKEVIGHYEFSVAPSSLFAPDGTMLHCSAESALKLGGESEQRTTTGPQIRANERVNMEPSFQLLLLLTPKIGTENFNLLASRTGRLGKIPYITVLVIPSTSPRYH